MYLTQLKQSSQLTFNNVTHEQLDNKLLGPASSVALITQKWANTAFLDYSTMGEYILILQIDLTANSSSS